MHKKAILLNRGLFFYVLMITLLLITTGYTQTININGAWSTTRNLDTLYPGAGDHSALVLASGTVDVPITMGTGVYAANFSVWTLTNAGIIRGDSGVSLGLGGTVINQNEITARTLNGSGIYLANGGGINSVTNQASGTITAGLSAAVGGVGVNLLSSSATSVVDNSGRIYAYGDSVSARGSAVLLNGGGSVTNRTSGILIGGYGATTGIGICIFGAGTVENFGQIAGNNYQGVYIVGNGTVTNRAGGTITASGATIGVNIASAPTGTGVVANETGASITGGNNGIVINGSGSVVNGGTVTGSNAYGIRFNNKISTTTFAGTYTTELTNSGTVSGSMAGLGINIANPGVSDLANVANTITNTGTIKATNGSGIRIQDATSTAISSMKNTIDNSGTITGAEPGNSGILIQGTGIFANNLTNSGTITGTSFGAQLNTGSVTNSGTIQGATGISFTGSGADSLVNSGVIVGIGGKAAVMGGGNDTVTLNTGSSITGTIDGGIGSDTLTFLGNGNINISQLMNFETITKEGTGVWTLAGTGSTVGNVNINQGKLAASGTISGNVNVVSGATLSPGNSPGTLTINGDFFSNGNLEFEIGGLGAGQYDVLDINGMAKFTGGNVEFDFTNGFNAKEGDFWDFLLANSISGWDKLTFNFDGLGTGLGWKLENIAGGERLVITQTGGGTTVPEPAVLFLLSLGIGGLVGFRKKLR
jgi:hypothetical protein